MDKGERALLELASIVESSDDAIISKDLNSIVTSWNPAAERIFGFSANEIIGTPITRLIPADRHSEEQQILSKIKRGERIEHFETVRQRKDGKLIDVSVTISPIKDPHGNIIGISKIARDITARKRSEAALKESEGRLKLVAEKARVGLVILTSDRRYSYANAAYFQVLGVPPQDLTGKRIADVLPALYEEQIRPRLDRAFQGERLNYELRRFDGDTERFYAVRYEPMGTGQLIDSVVVVITEITELRAAEANLRDHAELLDQTYDAVMMWDWEGVISFWNRRAEELYGFSRSEAVGSVSHRLLSTQTPFGVNSFLNALKENQKWEGELVHACKDGRRIIVESRMRLLRNGHKMLVLEANRDITQRKEAEEALKTSENRFRELADNIREVFWLTDPNTREVLYVSPAFEQIWGRPPSDLTSTKDWLNTIHPLDRERLAQASEKQVLGSYDEEYRIVRKDGSIRWIHARAFPIRNAEGVVYRIAGVAEDVTQRKKLEDQFRQSQKMESIGQLAGGVAHDFNNILAVIQMQLSLLADNRNLSAEQAGGIEQIFATVQRAAALTRQLLLFSRREVFQPRDIELSESVSNMLKFLRTLLGETIEIQLRLDPQKLFVHADPGMIDQVLMNLAVNARDAMPNGGRLMIETGAVEFDEFATLQSPNIRPGSFVRLSVSDCGCGMPPEILPRIFEPFFTTKDVGKGTGLGLATVYGIVQQHGGWINVYSEVGHGSTFRIYIPRLAKEIDKKSASSVSKPLPGGSETILLVEDEAALRTTIRTALSRLGYRILEAGTGPKALGIWREQASQIQLLLTDLVMPDGMTGRDLADVLMHESPTLKVIYMSGYSEDAVSRSFTLEEGVNFLAKPFSISKLATTIRTALDQTRK